MATFCLLKPHADKFRQALRDGTINPDNMADMSSKERHKFFADLLGALS